MKVVIVTGTPGTGKTTIAKKLARLHDFEYLDVNDVISRFKLSSGFDAKRKSKIIDTEKLSVVLVELLKKIKKENKKLSLKQKGIVIDSHLSHYIPKRYVDVCVVTKCDLKKLEMRLKKRRYTKAKIRENLDAEIFDVCHVEATEKKHTVIVIDTSKRILNKDLLRLF